MKKLLLFVTMAAALLFTQCKKDDKNSMPSEGKTVKMTVTAGPGRTDVDTETGAIKWSAGDKLYVGDGSKYIGCLTLVGEGGSATGVFTGDVDLPTSVKDGDNPTFHFFYLGSTDYTSSLKSGTSTSVDVDFSSQNIYKNGKKLENASAQHVGYGSATGSVVGNVVTDINVMMVSKVAIAHFSFKKGDADYEGALTLSGTNIYNKMTVGFNGTFEGTSGSTTDGITLAGGHGERYVMLVPTDETTTATLFADENVSGSDKETFKNGIKANQFYRGENGKPIAVTVTPKPTFTVGMDGTKPRTVEFAPGNLYYKSSTKTFHFEDYQHSYTAAWNAEHVGHFKWSDAENAVTDDYKYSGELFCSNSFTVDGDGGWRTLTNDEWSYLIGESTPGRNKNLRGWSKVTFGESGPTVDGLILMPDRWEGTLTAMTDHTAWKSLEASGAVFLPASGYRYGTSMFDVGSLGRYWSSTPVVDDEGNAYGMYFDSDNVYTFYGSRSDGRAVRLVR